MNARASIRELLVIFAMVALAGQLGCSKDDAKSEGAKDKGAEGKSAGTHTSTSEASSDSKLLALKFHHDK